MPPSNRHPGLLTTDQTLLVVIDMQEPFLRDIWERKRVVSAVNLLSRSAAVMGVPVIATVQYSSRMGGMVPEVAACLPGHSAVDKMCFSCAASDDFVNRVRTTARRQILLCGIEAHICVCQTALDLVNAGFHVHVAADAVSSRTEQTWQLGLQKMQQAGVIIGSAEGAIYEMLYEAGTPQFKEVLKLIKES